MERNLSGLMGDDWDADSCGVVDGNYECIAGYTFNSNYKLWISITKRFFFYG